jgi:hypothetical protein
MQKLLACCNSFLTGSACSLRLQVVKSARGRNLFFSTDIDAEIALVSNGLLAQERSLCTLCSAFEDSPHAACSC